MMLQPVKTKSMQMSNQAVNQSSSSSTASGAAGASAGSITGNFNYDDFLKLLVMQLKYQDPLNPLDNSEFATQNAQFSTVEQLMAIKKSLDSQKSAMDTANVSYSSSMIGKEVTADVSGYNEAGELEERYITGVVTEVGFVRAEGSTLLKLDNGSAVYLQQVVTVKEPTPVE